MPAPSVAYDVAVLVAGWGYGVLGTNLFVGWLPHTPDNCVALYDSGAGASAGEYAMGANAAPVIEEMGFQVWVRGLDYMTTYTLTRNVYERLRNFSGSANGHTYVLIRERYAPVSLGMDESRRTQFSLNFVATRHP